jgi:hypothetical protein
VSPLFLDKYRPESPVPASKTEPEEFDAAAITGAVANPVAVCFVQDIYIILNVFYFIFYFIFYSSHIISYYNL